MGTSINSDSAIKYHKIALENNHEDALYIQQDAKDGYDYGDSYYQQAITLANKNDSNYYSLLQTAGLKYHLPAIKLLITYNYPHDQIMQKYFWMIMGAYLRDEFSIEQLSAFRMNQVNILEQYQIDKINNQHVIAKKLSEYYKYGGNKNEQLEQFWMDIYNNIGKK